MPKLESSRVSFVPLGLVVAMLAAAAVAPALRGGGPEDEGPVCSELELPADEFAVVCQDDEVVLLRARSDATDLRCACRPLPETERDPAYLWTYGSRCASLPCYPDEPTPEPSK